MYRAKRIRIASRGNLHIGSARVVITWNLDERIIYIYISSQCILPVPPSGIIFNSNAQKNTGRGIKYDGDISSSHLGRRGLQAGDGNPCVRNSTWMPREWCLADNNKSSNQREHEYIRNKVYETTRHLLQIELNSNGKKLFLFIYSDTERKKKKILLNIYPRFSMSYFFQSEITMPRIIISYEYYRFIYL